MLFVVNSFIFSSPEYFSEILGIYHMKTNCQHNRRFPSCLSPQFQSESQCEAFHMEISFIHM